VWYSVWASVGASVRASVWASMGASVEESVWASVRASMGASVEESVWASVGARVEDSVRASVWASVGDSVGAYTGSFFGLPRSAWKGTETIKGRGYPFQPLVDLWDLGFAPSFDGKVWRLHAGKNAKVVFSILASEVRKKKI
ncbi:MAG: hypothetical protein KGL39_14325, partial [Patescibacteria group bacterium]|nr:hypothetical protein [Patescibacteria group bacterium]